MKIEKQEFRVVPATHDVATGEKLEPEQRPAEMLLHTSATLQLGSDPRTVDITGGKRVISGVVSLDTVAGEIAEAARKRCADCAHFSRRAWVELYKKWRAGSYEDQQKLNQIRATAELVNDEDYRDKHMDKEQGEIDTEHAIQALGICHALTEYWSGVLGHTEEIIFDPACSCPDEFGPDGAYLGRLFQPRDSTATKRGAKGYDAVMQAAQGRSLVVKPKK